MTHSDSSFRRARSRVRVGRSLILSSLFMILLVPLPTSAQFSGFLEEYPPLEGLEGVPNVLVWRASTLETTYRAIYFDPPELFLDPDSEYRGIQPDALKTVSDTLKEVLETNARERGHEVATELGPGVLRVRAALTNVYLRRQSNPHQLPINYAAFELRTAVGRRVFLVNATIEAEMLDAESGRRVGVMLAQEGPKSQVERNAGQGESSWSEVLSTLNQLGSLASRYFADLSANVR